MTPGSLAPFVPVGSIDFEITCLGPVCNQWLESPIENLYPSISSTASARLGDWSNDDGEGGEPICNFEWVDSPLGTQTIGRTREMHASCVAGLTPVPEPGRAATLAAALGALAHRARCRTRGLRQD